MAGVGRCSAGRQARISDPAKCPRSHPRLKPQTQYKEEKSL
ncbi:hypothetical protein CLOSTASPAR_02710 [[Clostridium] asparagiforme DSM 15981]|uniref:Uncharacterized protein n=1 Tax=[Clostridium] asparagiforme DSM 15981 TaxID=518636 RepID=C0D0C7_9FIRM|nr:hypothetical protein CLOSTASPAR_02710 [[Clostridium] asparagiforme DSM 15981]